MKSEAKSCKGDYASRKRHRAPWLLPGLAVGNSLSYRLDASFANLPSNTGNTQLPVSLKQFRMHGAIVYLF